MDNRKKIMDALKALQTRENDDAFVIFEHPPTQKFVQFAGSMHHSLMLDLPSQPLSETDFYRAVEYFKTHGVEGKEFDQYNAADGELAGQQFGFQAVFEDIEDAAQAAQDVLTTVYELPADCPLNLIEN